MDIFKVLEQMKKDAEIQGELAKIISIILSLGGRKLLAMKPILENLAKLGCDPEEPKRGEDGGHWGYIISSIARTIEMIGEGNIPYRALTSFFYNHRLLTSAAQYLPKPFCCSHLVLGSLALIVRAERLRFEHDLPGVAINWSEKLGKPEDNESVKKLHEQYHFLSPVVFNANVKLNDQELYGQYFGLAPGLRFFSSPADKKLFNKVCEKRPLQDIFAFCPLPTWQADHVGAELLFEKYNWQEQKNELIRLQRQFPGFIIRYATMPELMYLDLSQRLINGGDSAMGIASFRSEYPDNPDKCIIYGGVQEYGAKIEEDKWPDKQHHPVLPLFILKAEFEKKK